MTKAGYLKRLKRALKGVPKEEADGVVSYCAELIDDGVESGKSEAKVCAELDPPETVAENYLRENAGASGGRKNGDEPRNSAPFPLLIVGYFFGSILIFTLAVVVFAIAVSALVTFVTGLYVIVMSFGLMANKVALAFFQIGAGIAIVGCSFLLILLMRLCVRWLVAFTKWMGRGFCPSTGAQNEKSRGYLATLSIGGAFIVAGFIITVAGFGGAGFSYVGLVVADDVVMQQEDVSVEVTDIEIDVANSKIHVEEWGGEGIRVCYGEWDNSQKEFTVSDGVLSLTEQSNDVHWLADTWNRGIFWNMFGWEQRTIVIRMPEKYSGSVTLKTLNGAVEVQDIHCGDLFAETMNGGITLEIVHAEQMTLSTKNGGVIVAGGTTAQLHAETQNGSVYLNKIKTQSVFAKTQNGSILIREITGDEVELYTQNGSVAGSIAGRVRSIP